MFRVRTGTLPAQAAVGSDSLRSHGHRNDHGGHPADSAQSAGAARAARGPARCDGERGQPTDPAPDRGRRADRAGGRPLLRVRAGPALHVPDLVVRSGDLRRGRAVVRALPCRESRSSRACTTGSARTSPCWATTGRRSSPRWPRLYWIYNGPQTLLVAQAVLFALAIPPLWVFTRRAVRRRRQGDRGRLPRLRRVRAELADRLGSGVRLPRGGVRAGADRGGAGAAAGGPAADGADRARGPAPGQGGHGPARRGDRASTSRWRARAWCAGSCWWPSSSSSGAWPDSVIATYVLIPAFGGRSDYYWAYTALGPQCPAGRVAPDHPPGQPRAAARHAAGQARTPCSGCSARSASSAAVADRAGHDPAAARAHAGEPVPQLVGHVVISTTPTSWSSSLRRRRRRRPARRRWPALAPGSGSRRRRARAEAASGRAVGHGPGRAPSGLGLRRRDVRRLRCCPRPAVRVRARPAARRSTTETRKRTRPPRRTPSCQPASPSQAADNPRPAAVGAGHRPAAGTETGAPLRWERPGSSPTSGCGSSRSVACVSRNDGGAARAQRLLRGLQPRRVHRAAPGRLAAGCRGF